MSNIFTKRETCETCDHLNSCNIICMEAVSFIKDSLNDREEQTLDLTFSVPLTIDIESNKIDKNKLNSKIFDIVRENINKKKGY